MTKKEFEIINKKLDLIEEQLRQWQAILEEAKTANKKTVTLTPAVSYEPDVEVEVEREIQEQIDEIKNEAEEVNMQIGYAVKAGFLDADTAQAMTIDEKKSWLAKNWRDYDPF